MGNDIKAIGGKVGSIIQHFDTPQDHTDQGVPLDINQNVEDCKELNNLLSKHIVNLGSMLQLQEDSIVKNGPKWDKCLVRGILSVEVLKNPAPCHSEGENKQIQQEKMEIKSQKLQSKSPDKQQSDSLEQKNSQKIESNTQTQGQLKKQKFSGKITHKRRSYNVILTLGEMYELKRLLVSYTKEQEQLETKRKSFCGQLCVICLDNKPEQVLPCAHEYCKKCVEMYIVNKDKKCPMCRKSYQESLSENIYQIVEWDEDFVTEMRGIFYKILEKNNHKEVQLIRRVIEANEKYQKQITDSGIGMRKE